MEIKLMRMKLRNFKGIKDLKIDFKGKNTNIYGANATGKTTIFDAFKWVFFNKDSSNRTKFSIKTLDKDNKPIHFLEHEVEVVLNVDGVNTTFKKMYSENWVKHRGQEEQELSSHENKYWIDDVPVMQKEYNERVNKLIPEALFKMITDPLYFNETMSEDERKTVLMNIANINTNDEEIMSGYEEYKPILDNLNGRTINDYTKVLKEGIKKLNEQKAQIPIRIDELSKGLITNDETDYTKLENEKNDLNKQLDSIDEELTNVQMIAQNNMKKVEELTRKKNELNNLKFKLEVDNSNKYSSGVIKLENEKSVTEGRIRNASTELDQLIVENEKQENEIKKLREEWYQIESDQFEIDEQNFICPTCGREYPEEKITEIREKARQNFIKNQEENKNGINKEGQARKSIVEKNKLRIDELQNYLKQYNDELTEINSKLKENEENQKNAKPFDINEVPEYKEKLSEIEKLQKEVDELVSCDTTSIKTRKAEIKVKLDEVDKLLKVKEEQENIRARMKQLEVEETETADKINELEHQVFLIEKFSKLKVDLFENAINSHFNLVKFKLLTENMNGAIEETCIATVDGVPFDDLNNAKKITAGLDIINTLIKFEGKSAPIFIDNRESINELYNIDTQIISLIVTNDTTLRIEVM